VRRLGVGFERQALCVPIRVEIDEHVLGVCITLYQRMSAIYGYQIQARRNWARHPLSHSLLVTTITIGGLS
jgi:hypothetical protein